MLALQQNDRIIEFISDDVEERYVEPWFCDSDKAWDAIHRAFDAGQLTYEYRSPRHGIILGGLPLCYSEDYIVSYKSAAQVRDIAAAIPAISRDEFRHLYGAIDPDQYGFPLSDDDFEYSWHWLSKLAEFYAIAARSGRAVCFTADQ